MENLKKQIQSLTTLSEQGWEIMMGCMTEQSFKKNERLLREEEVCTAIFFISSGLCKAVYNKDGKDVNTAFYFENEFVTNVKSLTSNSRSEYSIVAYEKTEAVRLSKDKLLEAYKKSHEIESFGRKLLELVIAKQEDHLDTFKLLTPKERFNDLVARYPDFLRRVSLTQIASYLGISRETLSRVRAEK